MTSSRKHPDSFIRQVDTTIHHPDGTVEHVQVPAVWTLAHRGYSGNEHLDVWAYPSEADALQAGAELAMQSGLDREPEAQRLMMNRKYRAVIDLYEQDAPATHLLRVQPAYFNWPVARRF